MESITVVSSQAQKLQTLLELAKTGKLQFRPAYYEVKGSGNVLLADPVNDAPWVFVAPDTLYVFRFKAGDGTDHLRQRSAADLWFQQMLNQ